MPCEPMTVFAPSGNFSMMSMHCTARSAENTSSSVASGLPMRTLSRMLPLMRRLFWNTKDTVSISLFLSMSFTFTPPMEILPLCGSKKRATSAASVDLPPPEGPTNAAVCPAPMERETSSSAFWHRHS